MVPLLVYAPVSGKLYRKTECLQYLDENATRVLHYIHILRKKKFREALIIFWKFMFYHLSTTPPECICGPIFGRNTPVENRC